MLPFLEAYAQATRTIGLHHVEWTEVVEPSDFAEEPVEAPIESPLRLPRRIQVLAAWIASRTTHPAQIPQPRRRHA